MSVCLFYPCHAGRMIQEMNIGIRAELYPSPERLFLMTHIIVRFWITSVSINGLYVCERSVLWILGASIRSTVPLLGISKIVVVASSLQSYVGMFYSSCLHTTAACFDINMRWDTNPLVSDLRLYDQNRCSVQAIRLLYCYTPETLLVQSSGLIAVVQRLVTHTVSN